MGVQHQDGPETCFHLLLLSQRLFTNGSCKESKTLWLQFRNYRSSSGALRKAELPHHHLPSLVSPFSAPVLFHSWWTGTLACPPLTRLMENRRWPSLDWSRDWQGLATTMGCAQCRSSSFSMPSLTVNTNDRHYDTSGCVLNQCCFSE